MGLACGFGRSRRTGAFDRWVLHVSVGFACLGREQATAYLRKSCQQSRTHVRHTGQSREDASLKA